MYHLNDCPGWKIKFNIWAQFIESEKLNSNRENIEVYVVNLDVSSIGNQYFAFNELDSEVTLQ